MRGKMKLIIVFLMLVVTVKASPVTIQDLITQDKGQGSVVTTLECCEEEDKGIALWPLAFLGAVPILFIDRNGHPDIPPEIVPSVVVTPSPPTPMPEPSSLLLVGIGITTLIGLRRRK
jgi:hypothetical protein